MQTDGNLVLYRLFDGGNQYPVWKSDTNGKPANQFTLTLQDDGNLVLYGHTAYWDSKTFGKI